MRESKMAYSIDEAAECTGIGRNTLRKLIEWKKLPVLKVGRKLLIRADTIETFMELNEGNDLRNQSEVKLAEAQEVARRQNEERKPVQKKNDITR